jgi:hypothetical protein
MNEQPQFKVGDKVIAFGVVSPQVVTERINIEQEWHYRLMFPTLEWVPEEFLSKVEEKTVTPIERLIDGE